MHGIETGGGPYVAGPLDEMNGFKLFLRQKALSKSEISYSLNI